MNELISKKTFEIIERIDYWKSHLQGEKIFDEETNNQIAKIHNNASNRKRNKEHLLFNAHIIVKNEDLNDDEKIILLTALIKILNDYLGLLKKRYNNLGSTILYSTHIIGTMFLKSALTDKCSSQLNSLGYGADAMEDMKSRLTQLQTDVENNIGESKNAMELIEKNKNEVNGMNNPLASKESTIALMRF